MELLDKYSGFAEEVQSISRGPLCVRVQEKWTEIRRIADENKLDELTTFVKNLKDSDNFGGGVLHRNKFQISHKIALVALGFFGPHEFDQGSYDVRVDLELTRKFATLRQYNWVKVPATKREIFWVSFQEPCILQPGVFYNLAFNLEGPRTGICDPTLVQNTVISYVGDTKVEFSFLRGSLQMPQLKFILL